MSVGTLARSTIACALCTALSWATSQAAKPLPLRVSDNKRFLVKEDGSRFFYLGDTAWELFHRLNREEAGRYLRDRAGKGFTVIQAVVLAEYGGLTEASPYGHKPLLNKDPRKPDIKEGPDNDYWDHVDYVINEAESLGLYVGLLPTWGAYVTSNWFDGKVDGIFNPQNAQVYGEFIGKRYRDNANILWILGGDRAAPTEESKAIWRAMARGIAMGVSGREDYSTVLMTYHTSGPGHSSDYFHDDDWCDFDAIQSSHGHMIENWKMIEKDYARTPVKPIIDLETTYPDIHIGKNQRDASDDDARRSAYWAVFAGGFGHTYGHHSVWQMYGPGRKPIANAKTYWYDALEAPSAKEMGFLRRLMESRPFVTRISDQSLLASDPGEKGEHVRATRSSDGSYALVYIATGRPVTVRMNKISGEKVKASWYNPRTGNSEAIGEFPNTATHEFRPPSSGYGQDWVLVLDDGGKIFPAPGIIER